MKNKSGQAALIVLLIYVLLISISLMVTCALVKLITWCFGLMFSWKIALGVWFVILAFNLFFKPSKK